MKSKPAIHPWHVYILRCVDGTLYTGVAINVLRRVAEHNGAGAKGARYTRSRRPVKLVYQEPAMNRSAACRREYVIKQLTRREKIALIARPVKRVKSTRSAAESSRKSRRQNVAEPRRVKASPPA